MRLALISDIHEDFPSLKRVLKTVERIGYDRLICLGDICGFDRPNYRYRIDRDASACLALVRDHCEVIVPGNHDMHAARRLPEYRGLFDFPDNWYALSFQERAALAGDRLWLHKDDMDPGLSGSDLDFLRRLPEYQILDADGMKIMLSHYASPNLSGFGRIFYSWEKEFRPHLSFMEANDCRLGFIGHAHPRGFYRVDSGVFRHYGYRRLLLADQPQVIGIPPLTRHRHRRGFCIFDTDRRILQVKKIW